MNITWISALVCQRYVSVVPCNSQITFILCASSDFDCSNLKPLFSRLLRHYIMTFFHENTLIRENQLIICIISILNFVFSHRPDLLDLLEKNCSYIWRHYVHSHFIDMLYIHQCYHNLLNGSFGSCISLSHWNDSFQCGPKDKCWTPFQVCARLS